MFEIYVILEMYILFKLKKIKQPKTGNTRIF